MSENTKNIHQRLAAVMVKVDYIKKDKKVGEGGYMAVTHDVVASEVRPFFVENGILISPTIVKHSVVETGTKTTKGTPIIRLEAEIAVSFVNVDQPTDRETIIVLAHANDQGDKAPGKALSYAVKYAILKILLIETGENEEGRNAGEDEQMDADRIVELEAAFKAETNPAELKALAEKARQEARNANDEYASKRLVKAAAARAAELGIKPEPKVDMPRARTEAPAAAPVRAPQPPKAGEPASKGLIKTVRNLASQKDMSDGTLLQILEAADYGLFSSIDDLTKEAGAHLLEAIKTIETARA